MEKRNYIDNARMWRDHSFRFVPILRCCERGASIVEATVVIPLFLFSLLLAFDLLRISYCVLTMQIVATRMMREVVAIGPPNPIPPPAATFENYIEGRIMELAASLRVRITPEQISICPVGPVKCISDSAGAPGQLIALRIVLPLDGLIGGTASVLGIRRGTYNLGAFVLGTNEPYES